MFRNQYDIDRDKKTMEELFHRLKQVLDRGKTSPRATSMTSWPKTNLFDECDTLVAVMELPGVAEADLTIEAHHEVLTVRGERKVDVPEGYRVHRQERHARTFTRSFGLPVAVDLEQTTAALRDGLLTITMTKHPEAKPRQIAIKAS